MPKETLEEIKTIDNPIPIKETGLIIKYLLTENLWPQIEFYQTFKKKLVAILHKFFQESEKTGIFPNILYEASRILIPKPGKDIT